MQHIKRILKRSFVWRTAGLLALEVALFSITDASKAPAVLIILGFLMVCATIYCLAYGFTSFLRLYGITVSRKRRLSLYITAITGLMIALQSVGELGSRDILVLLPLVGIGWFYSAYAKSDKRLV